MRAVLMHDFGEPETLSYGEFDTPVPRRGEAFVHVHAVGVNRMDVEMRAGVYGGEPLTDFYFGKMMRFPHILGIEPAGVVEQVGEDVTEVAVGDRVVPHSHLACGRCEQCLAGHDNACPSIQVLGVQTPGVGGYAEYFCWPANRLIKLPDTVGFEQAAALLVNYGPVWTGLIERAYLRPGETLLVSGASGGAGHAAIEIGRLTGARVLGLAGSEAKMREIEQLGAEPIDYRDGFAEAVLEQTGGRGADVVCELVGADTFSQSVTSAAARGRVVVIGSHGGIRGDLNLGELFAKNLQIHGITRARQATMVKLVELAGEGKLSPTVWRTLPLDQAAQAHRLMEERQHSGKIVLTVS